MLLQITKQQYILGYFVASRAKARPRSDEISSDISQLRYLEQDNIIRYFAAATKYQLQSLQGVRSTWVYAGCEHGNAIYVQHNYKVCARTYTRTYIHRSYSWVASLGGSVYVAAVSVGSILPWL